jgi:hypothetical protein
VSDERPIDRELDRMAGNPEVAAMIKKDLERLATGAAGREFAEMAKELLEGRSSLRDVGQSAAYAAQFTEAAERYRKWYAELSPEQRAELDRTAREQFDQRDDG